MNKIKILLFLTLLLSLTFTSTITSVTLQNGATTASLQGSIMGGTKLYFQGLGFSSTMDENFIMIGQYPCILEDGATATAMVCRTTAPESYKQYWNLDIIVIVQGKQSQGAVVAPQKFSYTYGQTPYIYSIFPSVSYGGKGTKLYFYGAHRIFNLGADKDQGDVYGIYIGDSLCSRFGIFQDQISPNGAEFIQCYQATLQKAGKYEVSEHLFPGRSASYPWTYKATPNNNEKFQFVVLPLVNDTTHSGSINGQDLVIKGTGFSLNKIDVSVEVDGVPCAVSQSTFTQVKCRLQKKTTQSANLTSNSATPMNTYISGSGFFYQRYNVKNISPQTITKFKDLLDTNQINTSTLQDSYVSGQIKTQNVFGEYFGQVWKGYFVPTATGNHKFRGIADDTFALYLSTNIYGSTVSFVNATPIAYTNSTQATTVYPNYYQIDYPTSESAYIYLEAGKQYYMEVYHLNVGSGGKFSLSVEIPNNDTSLINYQTYEVHTITTSVIDDPEIVQFNSKGVMSGTINLRVYEVNSVTLETTIDQNVTFPWNADAATFCSKINQFSWFGGYSSTCTLAMRNSDGIVTDPRYAQELTWRVTISKYRTAAVKNHVFKVTYSTKGGIWTSKTIQQHSPPISGTFTASLGGTPIQLYNSTTRLYSISNIPYNVDASVLEQGFRRLKGFQNVEVERNGDPSTGAKWIIYYVSVNQDLPDLVLSNAGLLGGKTGTTPQAIAATRRNFSTNLFVDPIDYRWMRTYSNKPNVRVTVNDIPSACNTDCTYTFLTSVPAVTSSSLTGNTLSLTLTDPGSLNLALDAITVTVDNQPCTNLLGTMTSFTCILPKNADNTPILTVGSHFPNVVISPIGTVSIDPIVNPIDINLNLISVTNSSGGTNGGYQVTIAATGLPSKTSDITFTLCSQICTINSINNIEAKIIVPACQVSGPYEIVANYETYSSNVSFIYGNAGSIVKIISIAPISWSPVMKGVMNITGQGFGTDPSQLKVFLTNSSGNIYEMKVLFVNDTFIKAGIPGGLPGLFDVNVIKEGFGNAIAIPKTVNDFTYEVYITSVSPSSGSIGGGTLITITGKNFVPDVLDTMVTIGNELNQLCRIQSITETEIKCRTPPKNEYYSVNDPQVVTVDSKLIIPTNCTSQTSSCWFSYVDQNNSPLLESMSSNQITNGSITLSGQRFDIGVSTKVSMTNQVTGKIVQVTSTSFNSTSITFIVPTVQAGVYGVKARVDPIGESNGFLLTVNMKIAGISTSSLSVNGGQIKIRGMGFPSMWPNTYYNRISLNTGTKNLPLKITSMTPSEIVLLIPAGLSGRTYSFSITTPMKETKSISFSQQATSTPKVNLTSSTTIQPNILSLVTLNNTILSSTVPEIIELYSLSNPEFVYKVSSWQNNSTLLNFNVSLASGKYGFRLFDDLYGWYSLTSNTVLSVSKSSTPYTITNTQTSFNGGVFKITGDYIGEGAVITVNGQKGFLLSKTTNQAVFQVPQLITPTTQSSFQLAKNKTIPLNDKTKWGDTAGWEAAFDSQHSTIYSSNNTSCNVGIDIGQNLGVQLTRIRYFPNPFWNIAYQFIKGAVIQVSNDNTTWTTIATVDQTVHAGWNSFMISDTNIYRYVRFQHGSKSKCNIAELELTGIVMSSVTVSSISSFTSDVYFDDGLNTQTFTGAVEYREDHTPIITAVSPDKGDVFGGYDITLTGVYLDVGSPTVNIDGIPCAVKSSTSTQIVCTVGARLTLPKQVLFEVHVGDIAAILEKRFRYVMRWSDPRTWGTDLPPIDDDLVYVPQGMHLLVDQTTPILEGIIVENGTIEFADESDMTVSAGFITLRGGEFIAGTEEDDYDHKLTFVMYGNYYAPQQPMFGNKGIGCLECKFSMIGKKRTPTWTMIANTINAGENQFTVIEDVDWQVGEHIVVASTSYDHNEAEERVITGVSGRTITVDKNFQYSHYAGVENYGTDTLEMRAQVGLLTRNIVMMGDDTSVTTDYGSHLMLTGSAENGLVGKIAYTEFTKCGQPQIVGRYCHHFHMAGDVPESYSIGNSVHHSMARILTIHGVHFLYVAWNVGYRVKGHNFFIQDGVETNNVLEYNLAISSLLVNNMMQTDMSVASFWVTNPSNHLRHNHAAGSDFYGFWYEIKEHPDGPSATEDVCPIGNPLGESHDNVAHSNVRFGLRIFKLYSREKPCEPIRNDGLEDPWSDNPSVQSRFYNYVLWKNGEAGLLAEETGNMIFENFTIAESKLAGMEFYKTNFTREHVVAKNIAIIGKSYGNPPVADSQLAGSKGAILSRTGEMSLDNIRFYEFTPDMTVWQACSKCDNLLLYTNFGATYYASNIKYTNIAGSFYHMLGLKREVFYDLDGTLTNNVFDSNSRTSATLTYGWPHLLQDSACLSATDPVIWNQGAVCDQTVTIRQVMMTNLQDTSLFKSQSQRARMIASVEEVTNPNETMFSSAFSLQGNMEPKKQMKFSYSLPYITGRIYDIWWGSHIDYNHLAMVTTHLYEPNEKAVIFKFKYIDNRELFEIGPLRQGKPFNYSLIKSATAQYLDTDTCGNGDYYHNNADDQRVLHLCASGRNRSLFEYIDVNAIYCRYLCPAPPGSCTKEKTLRLWSNATQWPNNVMPVDGDNIIIPCQWTVIMDMNPSRIGYFEINGDLIIQDKRDITIIAENIWIKGGSIKAGSIEAAFTHQLIFQLNGEQNATGFTVSPDLTGNKMFVVTGRLQLFGVAPTTTWTRMTAFADSGATMISVSNTNGWKIGDQIGIAPSFNNAKQFQKVTITALTANTVTFTPALQYSHFGAVDPTIVRSYGTLDMRTAVGHLTRNIKIVAGNDTTWGFTLIQFGYSRKIDGVSVIETGKMTISGVQFVRGGQYDTEQAALQVYNVRAKTEHTIITKSSFHDCQDLCMKINNAFDHEITYNVFYNARKFHVLALKTYYFNFTNNLMIGVTKRQTMVFEDLLACFASYEPVNPTTDNITVTKNLCQGSQGNGYAVPDVDCNDIDNYPYSGNTAGSCQIGWIFARGQGQCLAAKGVQAYGCQIGHIMNPPGTVTTKFKNFIFADNGRSLTLRIGGNSDQKTAYIYDSYFTAISRPFCTKCYGTYATDCSGNQGVRLLTTGANGQKLPDKFGSGFDVVCKEQTIDGKAFIYNTEFNNFRQNYTTLPQCSNNVIFKPHSGASDITGSHHLFNSNCTDCQLEAYVYFSPSAQRDLGWFGGCGSILCTGMNNYLIHDHSGTFLPTKGVLLANNSWIGDNTPACTKIPSINGHYCTDEDFGVLEYESVAPDFNTRIMWPVYLRFDGGNWTSETNGWREWQWNGGEPLNKRLGRFVSVVQLHKTYNMTFTSMPPEDMTFKMQKRLPEGNTSDWVIVKLMYPKPNSIRVEVNGQTIKPISLLDNNGEEGLNTSLCGSNKFFYKNYTVHFVVTGDPNCKVRVSLTNSIQLTARFAMNIDDFFRDDGVTKFINRMCALLSINDTSRVKIVGVYTGSVQIISIVDPQTVPLSNSTTADKITEYLNISQMQKKLDGLIENGTFKTSMSEAGLGELTDVSSKILGQNPIETPVDQQEAQRKDTGMIIGIIIGSTIIVCLAIIGAVCYMRKRGKVNQVNQLPMETESHVAPQTHKSDENPSMIDFKNKKDETY